MCQFIETIRIEDGTVHHLSQHTERCNRTRAVFWRDEPPVDLRKLVVAPATKGLFKCRIVYGKEIQDISYAPYQMREVATLRLIADDSITYFYKSVNRASLNNLYAQRNGADDVLIVKNGRLTDTSIANVALYDGEKWCTPACPLLKGTMRAVLLENGIIEERDVLLSDLRYYSKIMLFNAMIDWGRICLQIDEKHLVL